MWIALLSLALADQTFAEPETPVEEEPKEAEGTLGAELGGSATTGNQMFISVTAGLNGSYRWNRSRFGGSLSGQYNRGIADSNADGRLDEVERIAGWTETARQLQGQLRYDYFLSQMDSMYALAGANHAPFSGLDLRTNQQVGYGRILIDNDTIDLSAEAGIDFTQEDYATPDLDSTMFVAARVQFAFAWQINENVSVGETLEMFENFMDPVDFRLYNTAELGVKLSDRFGLRLAHRLAFDNQPVPDFEPLDQTTTVTLVATIL